ncbi:MAG: DUF2202 domain-containing protein [Anaerolineales bacterium]
MFKKILVIAALVAVIGVLVFGAINRTQAKTGSESISAGHSGYGSGTGDVSFTEQTGGSYAQGQGNGGNDRAQGGSGNSSGELTNLSPETPGELSADESAALLYMREEEKLAHDVYVMLYSQWGLPIFQNISQSEQTHTEAVKTLIVRYDLTDPASSQAGVFTNTDLQAFYDELTVRGGQSLAEALKVGAAIEEIDILDLEERLTQTDNADIQQVFNNLLNGSYNHLWAFVSTLNIQTSETYQPQYLSAEAYETIISTSMQTGGNSYGNGDGQGGYHGGRP